MDTMKGIFLAVLLVGVIAVAHCEITCYDCSWHKAGDVEEGKECKKPDDDADFRTCPTGVTQCEKLSGETDTGEGVIRQCSTAPTNQGDTCEDGEIEGVGKGTRCFCNEDKCNEASTLISTIAIFPPILVAVYAIL